MRYDRIRVRTWNILNKTYLKLYEIDFLPAPVTYAKRKP